MIQDHVIKYIIAAEILKLDDEAFCRSRENYSRAPIFSFLTTPLQKHISFYRAFKKDLICLDEHFFFILEHLKWKTIEYIKIIKLLKRTKML